MPSTTCPSTDLNFLSPNGFILNINRLPGVNFFAQEVELPTISLQELDQATPLTTIAIPSDRTQFSALSIRFAIDEKMNNWVEVFDWMQGLGFPEIHAQYPRENQKQGLTTAYSDLAKNYSDAKLTILGSNNQPVRTITFIDCFPTSLSGIAFSTMNTDVQYATATLTMAYTLFYPD